jgi:hypothetical protein
MWLATQHGFYSIVEKKSGEFHVRARCRKDLENLLALSGLAMPIIETPAGDYGWRVVVGKPEVAKALAALGGAIDYSNFKDRIHDLPDQREKAPIYSRLWSQLYSLQSKQGARL